MKNYLLYCVESGVEDQQTNHSRRRIIGSEELEVALVLMVLTSMTLRIFESSNLFLCSDTFEGIFWKDFPPTHGNQKHRSLPTTAQQTQCSSSSSYIY
jgi:hypothetical protein